VASPLQNHLAMVLHLVASLILTNTALADTARPKVVENGSRVASIANFASHVYTAASMTDLPNLGTDRRVVLATMRHAGLKTLTATGTRLVFDGGLPGWPGVTRAAYDFKNNLLTAITLDFATPSDDIANHQLFWDVRDALAVKHGSPSFDRVRDSDRHRDTVLATQKDATIWANEGVKIEIEATYGDKRGLVVSVARDPHSEYVGEVASVTDTQAWAVRDTTTLTLATRAAAESLLDDFGDQQTIVEGARKKGAPINVRLKSVTMPAALAANAKAAVQERFNRFANGDWDVNAVADAAQADVDLVIEVVPVPNAPTESYQMRLSALIAHGTRSGKTLYSATLAIQ
jgi:hypothetical protein